MKKTTWGYCIADWGERVCSGGPVEKSQSKWKLPGCTCCHPAKAAKILRRKHPRLLSSLSVLTSGPCHHCMISAWNHSKELVGLAFRARHGEPDVRSRTIQDGTFSSQTKLTPIDRSFGGGAQTVLSFLWSEMKWTFFSALPRRNMASRTAYDSGLAPRQAIYGYRSKTWRWWWRLESQGSQKKLRNELIAVTLGWSDQQVPVTTFIRYYPRLRHLAHTSH